MQKNNIKFIAEVSSNHNGNLSRCKKFIDVAKDIGCYAVKFQLFEIHQLFSKEVLTRSKNHLSRKNWQLPKNFLKNLYDYSKKKKIKIGCTPFYLDAVDELENYIDFYKIASYELLWKDLFLKCIKKKKEIIFSTGMANNKEIENTLKIFKKKKFDNFSILRCNSNYPTAAEESNLKSIQTLRNKTKKNFKRHIKIGWSDHTREPGVILRAIHKYNAEIIEFHLDLDRKGKEFKFGHCWLPNEIEQVIKLVNKGLISDGNGKLLPSKSELKERLWRADPIDGLRPIRKIRKKIFK